MTSSVNSSNGIYPVTEPNDNDEVTKQNLERLHRMVLGKDKDINADYIQKFYQDIAQGVSTILIN